jgi:hypothetical protein
VACVSTDARANPPVVFQWFQQPPPGSWSSFLSGVTEAHAAVVAGCCVACRCEPAPGTARDDAQLLPWREQLESALHAAFSLLKSPTEHESNPVIAGEGCMRIWDIGRSRDGCVSHTLAR